MSEIKQVNTGKVELMIVKAPEGAVQWWVNNQSLMCYKADNFFADEIGLSEGDWTPLGLSTELTEEQCSCIVKQMRWGDTCFKNYGIENQLVGLTAKESFESLMQATECFTKNPLGPDLCEHNRQCYDSCQGSCWTRADIDSEEWEQAEDNTGTWLILKRI